VANQSGWYTHWVSIQRDIDERKQNEAALREAKEEAEAANLAKSEFLSRMSHELRTPLNAILGFGQLLEMDDLSQTQHGRLDYMMKGGRHLLSLINEVLDIASIEAGRVQLSIEPVPLSDALLEVLDMMRPLAAQSNIHVRRDATQECNWHVLADQQRFKQVLLNLLANAIKYNQPRGEVILSCEAENDRVRISVTDNGDGIPAEKINRLFVPFDRLDAEKSTIEGTGLGLALSKRLMDAMGGTLSVRSEVGQGSTFTIELPRAISPMEQMAHNERQESAPALPSTSKRTVLYIEDNLSNLTLIEHLLEDRSEIHLMTAMQGRLGLDLAREHKPDLILLDLHLPDVPGWEVLRHLKADVATQSIPVVVVSADATPPQVQRLLAGGAEGYLTKPLDVKQFFLILEETLSETKES
jgi:CheY-like chemotaxis protein